MSKWKNKKVSIINQISYLKDHRIETFDYHCGDSYKEGRHDGYIEAMERLYDYITEIW